MAWNARQHKSHEPSALEPSYHKAFPGLQDPVGKRILQCIENEFAQLIKFSADSSPCWPYSQLVCYWKVDKCTRMVDVQKRTHQRGVVPGPQLTVQEQARTSAEFWNSGPTHTTCYKSHIATYNSNIACLIKLSLSATVPLAEGASKRLSFLLRWLKPMWQGYICYHVKMYIIKLYAILGILYLVIGLCFCTPVQVWIEAKWEAKPCNEPEHGRNASLWNSYQLQTVSCTHKHWKGNAWPLTAEILQNGRAKEIVRQGGIKS